MEKTLSEYIAWIESMDYRGLEKEFPNTFQQIDFLNNRNDVIAARIAQNGFMKWKIINEYNKKLNPPKLQEQDLLAAIETGSEEGRDQIMRLLSIRGNLAKELLDLENAIDATMEELCITYRRIDKELKELIG